jgi:hypothetical protein
MAIVTVGISVLPNHTHDTATSNDGGALAENNTRLGSTLLTSFILMTGSSST